MTLSQKQDVKLSRAIMIYFILQDLNFTIKSCFSLVDSPISSLLSIGIGLIIAFVFVKNIKVVLGRSKSIARKSYMLFIAVYLVSCMLSISRGEPFTVILKDSALWTLCFWIPIGLLAYSVSDKRILYNEVYKLSFACSAILLFYFFWNVLAGLSMKDGQTDYSMHFSYALVLPLLLHIDRVLNRFSWPLFILFAIELGAILILGSRGTVLCILSYFLIRFLAEKSSAKQKFRNILLLAVGFLILAVISRNMDALNNIGLSSRILNYADAGEVTDLSGRDILWAQTFSMISEKPLLGYGLGGEYYTLSVFSYKTGMSEDLIISSTSPHNGFMELLVCFGIPLGILISLYILSRIFIVRKVADITIRNFAIILFSVFVIPSFTVGDGVFVKPGIAFFIYLMISLKKQYEQNQLTLHKGVSAVTQ